MNHSTKWSLLLLGLCLSASSWLGIDIYKFETSSEANKFAHLWHRDLQQLQKQDALQPLWQSIRDIEIIAATDDAKSWLSPAQPLPIPLHPHGQYHLEILILSWNELGQIGAIVQYNFINQTTQNMEQEIGRTFVLTDIKKSFLTRLIETR